jgi:hypothetical protein
MFYGLKVGLRSPKTIKGFDCSKLGGIDGNLQFFCTNTVQNQLNIQLKEDRVRAVDEITVGVFRKGVTPALWLLITL